MQPADDPASDDDVISPDPISVSSADDSHLPPRLRSSFRQGSPGPFPSPSSDPDVILSVDPISIVYPTDPPPTIKTFIVGNGLNNIGNTCFVNAILQCLIHTVPFVQSLCSWDHKIPCLRDGTSSFCALCVLRRHIELVFDKRRGSITPIEFISSLGKISSNFTKGQQGDAQEFYGALLAKLDACCLNEKRDDDSSPPRSIVNELFHGRTVNHVQCVICSQESFRHEIFADLSLPIKHAENLIAALESFTILEKDEVEKLMCGKCETKVSIKRQMLVEKEPVILAFHLKLLEVEGSTVKKIDKYVAFPLELNLRPFMKDPGSDAKLKYRLYGVVVHVGASPFTGHYFSFIRSFPKVWHRFDDEMVSRVTEEAVLQQKAYILFYAKDDTPWFSNWIEEKTPTLICNPVSEASPDSVLEKADTFRLHQLSQVVTQHDDFLENMRDLLKKLPTDETVFYQDPSYQLRCQKAREARSNALNRRRLKAQNLPKQLPAGDSGNLSERTAKCNPISGGKDVDEAVLHPDSSYKLQNQKPREAGSNKRKSQRLLIQIQLNQLRSEDPRRKEARKYIQVMPRSRVRVLHNTMFARLDPKKITVKK